MVDLAKSLDQMAALFGKAGNYLNKVSPGVERGFTWKEILMVRTAV